jgi:hypothetical protein
MSKMHSRPHGRGALPVFGGVRGCHTFAGPRRLYGRTVRGVRGGCCRFTGPHVLFELNGCREFSTFVRSQAFYRPPPPPGWSKISAGSRVGRRAAFGGPCRFHGPTLRGVGGGCSMFTGPRLLYGRVWCARVGVLATFGRSPVICRPLGCGGHAELHGPTVYAFLRGYLRLLGATRREINRFTTPA